MSWHIAALTFLNLLATTDAPTPEPHKTIPLSYSFYEIDSIEGTWNSGADENPEIKIDLGDTL